MHPTSGHPSSSFWTRGRWFRGRLGDGGSHGEAKGTGTGLSAEDQLGVHGMYVVGRRHGMRLDDSHHQQVDGLVW